MKRREFLKNVGLGLAGMTLCGESEGNTASKPGRPMNLLFIMTDQQRWDALGAAGSKYMHTPNLDRLAREGTMFNNCYVAQAVCSPSRASILSGLYPHAHKVRDNVYGVDDVTSSSNYNMSVTWPLLLQRKGYRTCWTGKWHLGEKAPKCFDEWHGFNSLLPHWMGKPYESEYRSDVETEIGLKFLEENRNRPFVLCQSYYPPHTPYTAPKKYWEYYQNAGLEPMEYYAAVSDIDANIGRLLAKLEDMDLLDSTFIIFTSDHGDHFGRRPGGSEKRAAYDDCARVPLLFYNPSLVKRGQVRQELVSSVDLMPTILDAADVKTPGNLHGESLIPLLKGKNTPWRTCVTIQNKENAPEKDGDNTANSRGVRTRDWKLIMRERLSVRAKNLRELYDLETDPKEQTTLYGPDHSADVVRILDPLEKWARKVGDAESLALASACRADLRK